MTVQQLINELQKLEDNDRKKLVKYYDSGEDDHVEIENINTDDENFIELE